jgi:protocatechuate 3,4-dioxygenase beta subunit
MKRLIFLLCWTLSLAFVACSQSAGKKGANSSNSKVHVGGRCEGCEAIYESPIPFEKLSTTDTLPDFNEPGPKILISGIVYERDGKTPAKDVVVYIYHTDQSGNYTPGKNAKGWEKRHGYIRGWVKTDRNGLYRFYTLRPAAYPSRRDPQHIHVTIKEPDKNEYWIDEYLFEDDPLLVRKQGEENKPRGGNGIIKLEQGNGLLQATRNIILGLNVPDYPNAGLSVIGFGLASLNALLNTL